MNNIYNNAVERWRSSGGNGTMTVPAPYNSIVLMKSIMTALLIANPNASILIISEFLKDKNEIIKYLTENDESDFDIVFRQKLDQRYIAIVDSHYVVDHINNLRPTLTVIYKPMFFTFVYSDLLKQSRFKLVLLDRTVDNTARDNFYIESPCIEVFTQAVIDKSRTSLPVEETRIGVSVDYTDEDGIKIKKATDEINQTLTIFDDLESINKARIGDKTINMSAMQFCYNLAYKNGWSETLDMSVEYNQKLDEVYSPTALNMRAQQAYNMMRLRRDMLASYPSKIEEILKIVKENKGKKILIINLEHTFADDVRDAINTNASETLCQCCHEQLRKVDLVDKNGEPVTYKSGNRKGEIKQIGAKAQISLYRTQYNKGKISILSVTKSPDKELNIEVDIVILTSPLCGAIEKYLYRLDKIAFTEPLKLYTLYCKGSMEERTLPNYAANKNHKIVAKTEIAVNYDENSDVIFVD